MKATTLTVAFLALGVSAALAQKAADRKETARSSTAAPAKSSRPQNVTPDEAEKLIKERQDLVVVDVRTPEEFEMGHIAGAKNASVIDTDFEAKLKELEGKPVLVHCTAGSRSSRAIQQMQASGKFTEIYHMNGGMNAWSQAGKTVVKTPKAAK